MIGQYFKMGFIKGMYVVFDILACTVFYKKGDRWELLCGLYRMKSYKTLEYIFVSRHYIQI